MRACGWSILLCQVRQSLANWGKAGCCCVPCAEIYSVRVLSLTIPGLI